MALVKTTTKDNATVNIHDDYIPKNENLYKNNLQGLYDVINIIARDLEKNNIDTKGLFYSDKELNQLPKEILI